MSKEIKCELLVSDYDCPAEDITEAIGLSPTEVIKKGSVRHADPKGIQPPVLHDQNVWILKSDLSLDADPEEHIASLLNRIQENAPDVIKLSVYGIAHDEHVGLHLEKQVILKIAELGISFDFDVY